MNTTATIKDSFYSTCAIVAVAIAALVAIVPPGDAPLMVQAPAAPLAAQPAQTGDATSQVDDAALIVASIGSIER